MREADQVDAGTLVRLMYDFYAESGHVLVEEQAVAAFGALLTRPSLGRIWLIERDGEDASGREVAGYIVVTFVFAMEHGGLAAVIDDFYVRPEARGKGLGKTALATVRRACEDLGVRALRVEVGDDNAAALRVYRSAGLALLEGHAVMQAPLAPPSAET